MLNDLAAQHSSSSTTTLWSGLNVHGPFESRSANFGQAHNLKVIGSNPIPATTFIITHLPSRSNRRDGFGFSGRRAIKGPAPCSADPSRRAESPSDIFATNLRIEVRTWPAHRVQTK